MSIVGDVVVEDIRAVLIKSVSIGDRRKNIRYGAGSIDLRNLGSFLGQSTPKGCH
jgi:hypothetical protein